MRKLNIIEQMFGNQGLKKAFDSYKKLKMIPVAAPIYYDILNERFGTMIGDKRTLVVDPVARKQVSEMFMEYYGKTLVGLQKTEMLKIYFDSLIKEGKELEL